MLCYVTRAARTTPSLDDMVMGIAMMIAQWYSYHNLSEVEKLIRSGRSTSRLQRTASNLEPICMITAGILAVAQ